MTWQGFGNTSSASVPYPANVSSDVVFAWINAFSVTIPAVSRPVITATGWTLVKDNGSLGVLALRTALYQRTGGLTGSASFTFDQLVDVTIALSSYDQIATSGYIVDSALVNDTGSSATHLAGPVDTGSVINCTLIVGWFDGNFFRSFFDSPDVPNTRLNITGDPSPQQQAFLLADVVQSGAGSSGTKSTNSNLALQGQSIMVALKPYEGPSDPTNVTPVTGTSITSGATVTVDWTDSTSPTAASSTLKYLPQYSLNSGVSWTNIIGGSGLTAAGVSSASFNTTGLGLTTGLMFRVQANDPASGLNSLGYGTSGPSSIIAETAPPAPVILSPTGGIQNKASLIVIDWDDAPSGNPQTAFTLQWSRDNFASHTATIGPTSTAVSQTSIDFSAEANGATISVKVKRTGVTLDSPYSATRQFTVASAPAAPNITDPVNLSPPTRPDPPITITSASAFIKRKLRVEISGVEVFSEELSTSALTATHAYTFRNGIAVTIFVSVQNAFLLWSPEDSEPLTPAYAVPATPTLTVTGNDDDGSMSITPTSSDTPDSYDLYKRPLSSGGVWLAESEHKWLDERGNLIILEDDGSFATAIKIADGIEKSKTFIDANVASGVTYAYYAVAHITTGPSEPSEAATGGVNLKQSHLHAVVKNNSNSNILGQAVILPVESGELKLSHQAGRHRYKGRDLPLTTYGVVVKGQKGQMFVTPYSDTTTFERFEDAIATRELLCLRDIFGNMTFGKVLDYAVTEEVGWREVSFVFSKSAFNEAIL